MSEIDFVPYAPEYRDEIIAMMIDFHEEMIPFGRGTFGHWARERFEERFPLPWDNAIFFIRSAGETLGYSWLEAHEDGEGYVTTFYLRPVYRGGGLGQRMLAHAEAWFRENGCDRVVLTALADNATANAFYAKSGFTLMSYKYRKDL